MVEAIVVTQVEAFTAVPDLAVSDSNRENVSA